jgi:tRNA pseudouridine synthase 10
VLYIIIVIKEKANISRCRLTAIPPQPSTSRATFESVTFLHESSYVGGRYLKYSREYSQTPWTVRGKKLAEYAVSDCFQPLLEKYHRADSSKFCTAGREDANVRMLGSGRPFYLELVNPRKPRLSDEEYKQIQEEVNSSEIHKDAVQVKRLCHIKP